MISTLDFCSFCILDTAEWDESPAGITTGGWGIVLRLEDMAKLGQLYLGKGLYKGKRILSESWVEQATAKQVDNAENPDDTNPDWVQGYGLHFWRYRHDAFRGDGALGQLTEKENPSCKDEL